MQLSLHVEVRHVDYVQVVDLDLPCAAADELPSSHRYNTHLEKPIKGELFLLAQIQSLDLRVGLLSLVDYPDPLLLFLLILCSDKGLLHIYQLIDEIS